MADYPFLERYFFEVRQPLPAEGTGDRLFLGHVREIAAEKKISLKIQIGHGQDIATREKHSPGTIAFDSNVRFECLGETLRDPLDSVVKLLGRRNNFLLDQAR